MAIFVALQLPEVEVIGLTTIYGNVYTTLATRNALHLVILLLNFRFILFYFKIFKFVEDPPHSNHCNTD